MTKIFRHPSVILEKRTQKSRSEVSARANAVQNGYEWEAIFATVRHVT